MTSTTAHDLPYQVGGDRPCDAPDVWCDFTTLLDQQMNATDLLIKRYQPTISMAKLTRDTDEIFVTSTQGVFPIRFEAVEVDTDDMADFSVTQFNITPHRIGSYFITASVSVASGDVDNFEISVVRGPVTTSTTASSYNPLSTTTATRGSYTTPFIVRAAGVFDWAADDYLGFGVLINPLDSGTFSMQLATLAVYWVSDLQVNGS
jgi:hypothetical protein